MLDTCPSAARRVRAAARAQGEAAGGARPTATDWQRDARLRSMCASPPSASQKSAQGKVVGDAGQVRLYVIKRAGAGCPAPHAFRSGFLGPHTQVASREHGSCTPRHSPTEAIPTSPQGHSPTEQGVRGKKGSMPLVQKKGCVLGNGHKGKDGMVEPVEAYKRLCDAWPRLRNGTAESSRDQPRSTIPQFSSD